MSEIAITIENLSKRYRIDHAKQRHDTLRDSLAYAVTGLNPFKRSQPELEKDYIWALKDISFEVERGEVIGIIGPNGAGKSTLLKILTRITEPTSGRALINGRVGSLLEVGTGFHSELTGRENIYLNGAILGMRRSEIERKFDEIVAFSEIEKFLDTPVKRYSSGMYVRLAFAVAAHLEPEILLVDEVLAVGDVSFQQKCLGKMGNVANEGKTILFVSHNMAAIRTLCTTSIFISNGKIKYLGSVHESIDNYLANIDRKVTKITDHIKYKNEAIEKIESIKINSDSMDMIYLPSDVKNINIDIQGCLKIPLNMDIEVRFFDLNGTPLAFFSPGHSKGKVTKYPTGNFRISRSFSLPSLTHGEFLLQIDLTDPGKEFWVKIPNAARILTEGTPSSTGYVFEYNKGTGWVILHELDE